MLNRSLRSAVLCLCSCAALTSARNAAPIFHVSGGAGTGKIYAIASLPTMTADEVRASLSRDEPNSTFQVIAEGPEGSVALTFQRGNYNLLSVNGAPLEGSSYNYSPYTLTPAGALDSAAVAESYATLAGIHSADNFIKAGRDTAAVSSIRRAVSIFAFLFADASRFEDVHNGTVCALEKGDSTVRIMDYGKLLHNWETISHFITSREQYSLETRPTYDGDRDLIAPITDRMLPAFNAYLSTLNPPPHTSPAGKNMPLTAVGKCSSR